MKRDLSDFITDLVRRMVDHPDAVRVRAQDGDTVLYELTVDPEDQGRIIGREGRTIRSLRSLVGAAARKAGDRATLEMTD